MFKPLSLTLASALLATAGAASAQDAPPPGGKEVSIPFVTHGNVRTFTAARNGEGVYIQNSRRDWFFASVTPRCQELPWANAIGFTTFGGGSTLERGDTILAGRDRCTITSIVRSGPPPKKVKKPKRS